MSTELRRSVRSRYLLTLLFVLLCPAVARGLPAQQPTLITGTIVDPDSRPLPDVVVQVLGSDVRDVTDANGDFVVSATTSENRVVLRFVKPGFATRIFSLDVLPLSADELSIGAIALELSIPGAFTLTGTVHDSVTGDPIVGAGVFINTITSAITNDRGTFTVRGIPTGRVRVSARRVGYRPMSLELWTAERQSEVGLDVVLEPLPLRLSDIIVEGERTLFVTGPMTEFYRRRQEGTGHYFTPAEIEERDPLFLTDLLRRVPGVRVTQGSFMGDHTITLSGTRSIIRPCASVQVYIDGVRANGVNIDAYPPSRVQAMEVYTRPSQIPPEFNAIGSVCGVVAIWTK
ncbi:MAG: carboxypeptidase regulatory-like domain-containing protein [Gemmatimonadetes bacterium]|nr:carboxypeptidase regulatory-like domain-containing protein [Gemmatimonadota bacterium]